MKWLFRLCCAGSLALLLAVAIFWVRGYWVQDLPQLSYQWYPEQHLWNARWFSIRSANGRFEFGVVRNDFDLRYPSGIVSSGGQPGWVESFRRENLQRFTLNYHSVPMIPNHRYATVGDRVFGFGFLHQNQPTQSRHDEY